MKSGEVEIIDTLNGFTFQDFKVRLPYPTQYGESPEYLQERVNQDARVFDCQKYRVVEDTCHFKPRLMPGGPRLLLQFFPCSRNCGRVV